MLEIVTGLKMCLLVSTLSVLSQVHFLFQRWWTAILSILSPHPSSHYWCAMLTLHTRSLLAFLIQTGLACTCRLRECYRVANHSCISNYNQIQTFIIQLGTHVWLVTLQPFPQPTCQDLVLWQNSKHWRTLLLRIHWLFACTNLLLLGLSNTWLVLQNVVKGSANAWRFIIR